MNPRIVTAAVTVLAGHALLLTGALLMRNDVPHRPLESKTITAQLLSAPVAQPAGIQSAPAPTPPQPVPKAKPKPAPTPVPGPSRSRARRHCPSRTSPRRMRSPRRNPRLPRPWRRPKRARRPRARGRADEPPDDGNRRAEGRRTPELPDREGRLSVDVEAARRNGVVKVRFVVGLTGKIESAQVVQSSGFARLDDAALDAIRSSPCQPYLQNGQPMRAAYTQPYDFTLTD